VLALRAENMAANVPANPAGLIATVALTLDGGKRIDIKSGPDWRTDNQERAGWQTPSFDDASWKPARVAARYGEGPWGRFSDSADPSFVPHATGIAGQARIVYVPEARPIVLKQLEPDVKYAASYFDPATGDRAPAPAPAPDAAGACRIPPPAWSHDWVLVMRRQ
jgi:hypothetical protein